MSNEFLYLVKIIDESGETYYLKSTIDEKNNTILIYLTNFKQSWTGTLNQEQVRVLAKKFPTETNDSFYSHTQRAFSKGNKGQNDGQTYVFNCKKHDKNRLDFIWKEKVEALNSLKIVGNIELQERPNEEILPKVLDYSIDAIETLRSANEQKRSEIQRINSQLEKALQTIKRTVDLKEQLEQDLYKKFVLVLNTKKTELARLKHQIDELTAENGDTPISMHTEHLSSKRSRESDTDEDESQRSTTQQKLKVGHNTTQDSSLDLGNDQMDYRPSTVPKHHQRREYPANTSSISTRPFVHHTSTIATPSLPDDSQTTEDLLNKI